MTRRVGALLIALALAGCGGGSATPGSAPAKAQGTQTGSLVLSIPTRAPAGKVRYPQFVSSGADSVTISTNGGPVQTFDISPTSPLCTTSGVGVRTCTLTFIAPFGADTFAITLYTGANATGTVLATATGSANVVAGTPFTITVAVNAVIGTLVAHIVSNTAANCPNGFNFPNHLGIQEGCAGTGTLNVTVFDPSGVQVTGSAPFASPIQVSANDPSLSASPSQITAPGQTSLLSYSGVAFGPTITNSVTFSLTVGTQAVTLSIPVLRQYLYVANGEPPPTVPSGGGNIAVYTFGSGAGALPARVISGGATQLTDPVVPLIDAAGNLYVLDNGTFFSGFYAPSVLVFPPGASGNVAPIRQITGIANVDGQAACEAMVLDPTGNYLFVLCGFFTIYVFPVGANGTATATQVAQISSDNFNQVIGEGFDAAGNLYLPDFRQNVIWESAGPISPTVTNLTMAPANTLSGGSSWPLNANVDPVAIKFDQAGTLYASIVNTGGAGAADANNEIGVWQAQNLPCNGCAQSGYLLGGALSNHVPAELALDGAGNLYVSFPLTNQVQVFSAATVSSAGNPTNNPAVLHTIGTASAPNAPVGLAIGP